MKHTLATIATLGLAAIVSIRAGGPAPQSNPLSAELRSDYRNVRDYVLRSAEKMPDSAYAFKPTPQVRSFAQLIAHIADDQYNLCAPAKGEKRNAAHTAIESSLSTKAELLPALKAAFAYCDAAYDNVTDAAGSASSGYQGRTKFGMLNWNLWHTWEHQGNIVTYLRLNGLVPSLTELTMR